MFLSINQVRRSLPFLSDLNPFFGMSFLAFKEAEIPIGVTRPVIFSQIAQRIMERHYKPTPNYAGFYTPFKTSDQSKRWKAARYASTSLQRITTDTFGDTLIHRKTESSWGWKGDYVRRLKQHLGGQRIPAFHLAVWLFRDREWPETAIGRDVVWKLFSDYRLKKLEIETLFDDEPPEPGGMLTSGIPISEADLLGVIGNPPGWAAPAGAALRSLEIREAGPARILRYEPADRLNIITGNNSLGKTFLLECLWWALTGNWLDNAALPRREAPKALPRIKFSLSTPAGRVHDSSASYNWDRQGWVVSPSGRKGLPGLVIYSRFDGSFAIWDPARSQLAELDASSGASGQIFLSRKQIWDGSLDKTAGTRERWVCNGILRDWLSWQTGGERYQQHYSAFLASLTELSPSQDEQLGPGEPYREALESRAIPTLRMPYGDVPVVYASAAVQRIVALAYALVWAWQEHLISSSITRREPQRSLVLIVDEVEAHLHPIWQRLIVPAIVQVTSRLSTAIKPQLHIATHSPLVLASIETLFDDNRDKLHHLRLLNGNAVLEELPFIRRGRADLWLMSEVFGLGQARSLPAELAIEEAKSLQLSEEPSPDEVRAVDSKLVSLLAADDDFWPRWRYFAEQNGVKK